MRPSVEPKPLKTGAPPGVVDRGPDLGQERLARRRHEAGGDRQATRACLARQLMDHRRIALQHVRPMRVHRLDDASERPGRGHLHDVTAAWRRERLSDRARHVRRLVGGDHRDPHRLRADRRHQARGEKSEVAREHDPPGVAVVDEDAAQPARAAGCARVVLVEQVGVGRERVEVTLDEVTREPRIGDDRVEVGHEVPLGHDGHAPQIGLGHPRRVEVRETVPVPWRRRLRMRDELAQPSLALGAQLLRRPLHPCEVPRDRRLGALRMRSPQRLVVGHARTVARSPHGDNAPFPRSRDRDSPVRSIVAPCSGMGHPAP